ncbi:hypothetical protein BRAS3843_1340040 [Bradyrhizobium sp. STM 3843]|nr:hypothetical protein BRAS3843_1340040 [Bradyrhizobium sp. STM 3843]
MRRGMPALREKMTASNLERFAAQVYEWSVDFRRPDVRVWPAGDCPQIRKQSGCFHIISVLPNEPHHPKPEVVASPEHVFVSHSGLTTERKA